MTRRHTGKLHTTVIRGSILVYTDLAKHDCTNKHMQLALDKCTKYTEEKQSWGGIHLESSQTIIIAASHPLIPGQSMNLMHVPSHRYLIYWCMYN